MKNNVIAIVAHPDDELIGVGGTLIKHIKNGDRVSVLILSTGITSRYKNDNMNINKEILQLRKISEEVAKFLNYNIYFANLPDQKFDTISILEIIKIIESWLFSIKPNIIYTHNYSDLNIDHRLTFTSTITAARPCNNQIKEIYSFKTLSSTEWQAPSLQKFKPNFINNISKDILDQKIAALKMYKDEIKENPHPRSIDKIVNEASINGSIILKEYAEVFEIIRIIKD